MHIAPTRRRPTSSQLPTLSLPSRSAASATRSSTTSTRHATSSSPRIPDGSSVMTNTSVTLQESGIAEAIDVGGPYDSARTRVNGLDFATQLQEMKAIAGQSDFSLGSDYAITREEGSSLPWHRQPAFFLRLTLSPFREGLPLFGFAATGDASQNGSSRGLYGTLRGRRVWLSD
jgi:hypothetical protein